MSVKVMLLAPAFRNLDAALEEASKISGASGWHTFFHIVIPVMMPAILVTTILGLIRSLEAFEIELLLGTPIGLQVYSTKIHELVTWEPPQFAPAMALSTVFLGILLLMVALQRRYIAQPKLRDGNRSRLQHASDAAGALALSGLCLGAVRSPWSLRLCPHRCCSSARS